MYWSRVVFKTREISQQVLFHNFHLISFLVLTTRGATTAVKLKFWNCFTCLLFARIYTYVSGSTPMNVVVTRMQDFRSEFSKTFRGDSPDPHSGRGRPAPASTPSPGPPALACGRARGASAQVLRPKPWSPQLFSCGCAPGCMPPIL